MWGRGLFSLPSALWVSSVCLFNEWMKTVKIMRNMQRAVSGGEQIMGRTQSEDGDSWGQQILIVMWERGSSGRGHLPSLLLQPAQTLRPWPGNTWVAQRNSNERSASVWAYHTEFCQLLPLVLRSPLDPILLILSVIFPVSLCAQGCGVSFLLVAFMS